MNSILIIGAGGSGKSTTMQEVCKQLQPTKILKLNPNKDFPNQSSVEDSFLDNVFNFDFIITVQTKNILIVSGSPTEQKISITTLIDCCHKLGFVIHFAIVNMRSFERMEGFDTKDELLKMGNIVHTEHINKMESDDFQLQKDWIERVNRIVKTTLINL